ncbi:MAG: POTRA domain-containing protein, partial [Pyramidobacter sp.]
MKLNRLISGLAALLFFCAGAWAQPVSSLKVEGNHEVAASYILQNVRTRVGAELDRETVRNDIQAIYDLGFFSYVDAQVESTIDGLVLTYLVTENPVIKDIR